MTEPCGHHTKTPRYGDAFVFNPYEVALVAPRSTVRPGLAGALLAHGIGGCAMGHVVLDEPAAPVPQHAAATAVHRGGRWTTETAGPPQPLAKVPALLACDAVLAESAAPLPMPTISWVDEAGGAVGEHAVACVGRGLYRPELDRDLPYFSLDEVDGLARFLDTYFKQQAARVPLYGLVLAGGKSTRMRRDKALLEYRGRKQLEVAYRLLEEQCSGVYVSCRADQAGEPARQAWPQLIDAFGGLGPMGGILTALTTHPGTAWLVLACDLPFVSEQVLDALVAARNPYKIATAFRSAYDGLPEPLCAVYEPKSVFRLFEFLAAGYQCPRKVLLHSEAALLESPEPRALDNVNDPGQYAEALGALRQAAPGTMP